jgi:hypothetical protein
MDSYKHNKIIYKKCFLLYYKKILSFLKKYEFHHFLVLPINKFIYFIKLETHFKLDL